MIAPLNRRTAWVLLAIPLSLICVMVIESCMHACYDVPACLCFGGPMGLGSRTDALDVAGQASPASGAQLVQLGSSLGC
jgi:hypothetical protein